MPCEDAGGAQGNAAEALGHQRWSADHLKLGERPETDSPSPPSEGTHPADTLPWDFQPL